jgi:fatty acid desaturase
VNEFLTNLLAWWPLLLTNGGYRALHTDHHRHLSTDRDPEIVHKKSRAPQWDLPAPLTRILGYAAKDLVGYSLPDFWIIVTFSKPPRKTDYLGLAAFHLITNAVLLSVGLWWVSALWYGALVTAFMMFFRLRLWLEHQVAYSSPEAVQTTGPSQPSRAYVSRVALMAMLSGSGLTILLALAFWHL